MDARSRKRRIDCVGKLLFHTHTMIKRFRINTISHFTYPPVCHLHRFLKVMFLKKKNQFKPVGIIP